MKCKQPDKRKIFFHYCFSVDLSSTTLAQQQSNNESTFRYLLLGGPCFINAFKSVCHRIAGFTRNVNNGTNGLERPLENYAY